MVISKTTLLEFLSEAHRSIFDLGLATERALSWDKSFSDVVGLAPDLIVGDPDTSGQITHADKRDLLKFHS